MKWLLAILSMMSMRAFAGGDLPFPFETDPETMLLQKHLYTVENTPLTVQVRVFADPNDASQLWAKVLVNGEGDFQFDREWVKMTSSMIDLDVHINASTGHLWLDLTEVGPSKLEVDGQTYVVAPSMGSIAH